MELIQLDLFAKEKAERELLLLEVARQKEEKEEKKYEKRIRHLFGETSRLNKELKDLWEIVGTLYLRKTL